LNTIALINNLIKEQYPRLHNLMVVIRPDEGVLVGAIALTPFSMIMVLNRTMVAKINDLDVLIGLILHEFEHANYILSLPYWRRVIFAFKYMTKKGYKEEEDRVEHTLRLKSFGHNMDKLLSWRDE
jgi:hypothetical protein